MSKRRARGELPEVDHAAPIAALLIGAAGLVLEIVAMRQLALMLGLSAYATAATLASFMLGLAIGNWTGDLLLRGGMSAHRLFAAAQIALAICMAGAPSAYGFLMELGAGANKATLALLAFAALAPPTICIGLSFPALIAWAKGKVAVIYAWNTFGGVAGALLAGFVLIPSMGMRASLRVAAAMAVAAALIVWRSGRVESRDSVPEQTAPDVELPSPAAWLALAVCCVSGFTALAYQVLWTRVLTLFFRDTVYDFTVVLAVFLAGIAAGSLACRKFLNDPNRSALALGWTQLAIGAVALSGLQVIARLPYWLNDLQTNKAVVERFGENYWLGAMAIRVGYAALVIGPAAVLFGAAFPLAARVWMAGGKRGIGTLTAVNAIGTAAGAVAAGFFVTPLIGIKLSIALLAAINAMAGAALLVHGGRGKAAAGGALVLAVAMLAAPRWDKLRMSAGFLEQHQAIEDLLELQYYREDAAGIVSVVELVPYRQKYLMTNRVYSQNTSDMGGAEDHRRLGMIPMLLHRGAARSLAVGLGAGITLRGMAELTTGTVTAAELMPGVVQAARSFAAENANVLDRNNVEVAVRDGRNYLLASNEAFDVIVLDILHPMSSGSSGVFSREYYELCRRRMAPGGLVCQWLPAHQLSTDGLKTIMRTFQSVFPHTTVWRGLEGGTTVAVGLIGTEETLTINQAAPTRSFDSMSEATKQEMKGIALDDPAAIEDLLLLKEEEVAHFVGAGRIETDDRPFIEFEAPRLAATAARQGEINLAALKQGAAQ